MKVISLIKILYIVQVFLSCLNTSKLSIVSMFIFAKVQICLHTFLELKYMAMTIVNKIKILKVTTAVIL